MDNEQNIRPLTRKEQLEWLIPFLQNEIYKLELELQVAQQEYDEIINQKQLILRKEDNISK